MITLESVLNDSFYQSEYYENNSEYNSEMVELMDYVHDCDIIVESMNSFVYANVIMEQSGLNTSVQMEGVVDAIKNFIQKIKEFFKKIWDFISGPFRKDTNVSDAADEAANQAKQEEQKNGVTQSDIDEILNATDINEVKARSTKVSIYSIPYDISYLSDNARAIKYFKYENNDNAAKLDDKNKDLTLTKVKDMILKYNDDINGNILIITKLVNEDFNKDGNLSSLSDTDTAKYLIKKLTGGEELQTDIAEKFNSFKRNLVNKRSYIVGFFGMSAFAKEMKVLQAIFKEIDQNCQKTIKNIENTVKAFERQFSKMGEADKAKYNIMPEFVKYIQGASKFIAKIYTDMTTIGKRMCAALSINTRMKKDKKYRKEMDENFSK